MGVDTNPTISEATSVGEIVIAYLAAAEIFERSRIDYFNTGDLPLSEACSKSGADLAAVLEQIRAAAPSPTNWKNESLQALTDHILSTHHVFTRAEVIDLTILSERVRDDYVSSQSELNEICRLVSVLEQELIQHMTKEEQILFPFVTALESALDVGSNPPLPFFGTVQNPIQMMVQEHDAVGDMLDEMRRLTSDYGLPGHSNDRYREFYGRLEALEKDLHLHIHLENNIYYPASIELEKRAVR